MTELTSYLKQLKFDPKLKEGFFAKYLQNTRLVLLVLLLVCFIGAFSYVNLPRVLNPQINIPIVTVATALPGASPQDVESLVTVPIEDSVDSIEKVKTVTSSSQDSISVVTLEFESGVNPDDAKADVQSAVDSINDLPEDAQSPSVQKLDFENTPVWMFSLTSNTDYLSMSRFAKTVKDGLEALPSIDRVETTGLDNDEIQVLLDPEAIATYGISPQSLSQTIKSATGSFPAGSVTTSDSSFVLSLDPTVTTIDELRKIRVSANGRTVTLGDIAKISERNKPDVASSYLASDMQSPVETISFSVYKTSSANITSAVTDAKKLVDTKMAEYPNRFTLSSILNSGAEVDKQYYELLRDLFITVGLVFLTLFLFLGIRQAVVASFSIPLTFLITFIVMNATGIDLSFIAFFSLLLSLGLLVDDTIVVISALTAYYRSSKFTPIEAALLVWRDFKTAILTTTLTTVWAFVPLLLSTGVIGEFIRPIPIVVSSTLLGSLIVAVFITMPFLIFLFGSRLPHRVVVLFRVIGMLLVLGVFIAIAPKGAWFLPTLLLFVLNLFIFFQVRRGLFKKVQTQIAEVTKPSSLSNGILHALHTLPFAQYVNHGVINFEKVERGYRRILQNILANKKTRRKTVLVVVIFSLFSYSLLPLGFVRNEFFPPSDQEFLYASLELPAGTNVKHTNEETLTILNDLRHLSDVSFVTATMKQSIDASTGGYSGAGDNTALFTLVLPPLEERSKTSMDIAQELRDKYGKYEKGTFSVVEVSGGPPAGADLQIKLSGDDLATLDGYATKIQDYLKQQSGVANVSKSVKSGTSKVVFVPDQDKMLAADISQQEIGMWLRSYVSGFTLEENTKLHTGTEGDKNIVFRSASEPQSLDVVNTLTIPVQKGSAVPLTSLGRFELRTNPTLITRENGKRTLSVSASVTKGTSSSEKSKDLEKFANSLNLPSGYSWSTGGVNEENQNSVNAILAAMVLSFMLIIITMVLQFASFRKALIVMLVIPLSISGVFILFSLTRTPLSFPALIGVLALFGIVVKNAILIVDKINQNLKHKMSLTEAIVDGAESRLEPITLTTFATIVGLIPITLSDPLWQGLGGAIISGLFFSGAMMLFFIPVVYYYIFRNSEGKSRPS